MADKTIEDCKARFDNPFGRMSWFAPSGQIKALAWALTRIDISNNPTKYGLADLVEYACTSEQDLNALATERAFMMEAQAGHLQAALRDYERAWETERSVALVQARDESNAEYLARWQKEYVGSFEPDEDRDTRA
jgi:hypothetical protein